ncbi:MAG: LemA family protein [Candidatus Omnitrophica bacterium]|nr:LemA family protein [Candidatus Omnitrophota bacterium]
MVGVYILLGILFVLIVLIAGIYNGLIRVKNHCDESWADIDTELKRRYNLIPNLVETVKGYAAHEKEVFERVIQARNQAMANNGSPESQAKDENVLIGGLRQLFALAENYPDLKANQNFLELQKELANTEDRIQRARRFYNGNVRDLINRIEIFPSNIIASMFGFQKREYFEIEDETQRAAPKVEF